METFIQKFAAKVTGTLDGFDRVIFKGHLRPLSFPQGMERLLARHGLLIKDFARFVETHSDRLVQHAKDMAANHKRPYQYLPRKIRKDDLARRIAERDGIRQGLICIFSELESCPSFKVAYAHHRH